MNPLADYNFNMVGIVMAFNQATFSPVGPSSTQSPKVYSYSTPDSVNDVVGTAYFFKKRFQLKEDDIVMASTSGGQLIFVVTSDTSTVVQGAQLGPLGVRPTKIITVNQESDFPAPVAGVITLAGFTQYIISDDVTTANRFVMNEGTKISGNGAFASDFTYTGTGDMFTGTAVAFEFDDLSVKAPNANQIINVTGSLLNTVLMNKCRFTDTPKLGTFNSVAPVCSFCSFLRFDDGFTFLGGPFFGFVFLNVLTIDQDAGAIHYDLGSAIFLNLEFKSAEMDGIGTCISSSVGGANFPAGLEATVLTSTFGISGGMTPLSGFTNGFQANQWIFANNSPLALVDDSKFSGDLFLLTANTLTVVTQGVFVETGTPGAGSWDSDIGNKFTLNAAGYLTYVGIRTIDVEVIATASIEKVGGGSDELEGRIAKNWTAGSSGESKSQSPTENSAPASITMTAGIQLATGDTIRIIYANNDSTADIIVNVQKIDVTGR